MSLYHCNKYINIIRKACTFHVQAFWRIFHLILSSI